MSLITQQPIWNPDVYQIDVTDPLLGGPSGPMNAAAQSLANRTLFLHTALTANGGLGQAKIVTSGSANALQEAGFYSLGINVTDKPGTDRGHLIVSGASTTPGTSGSAAPAAVVQMFFLRTGEVYSRQFGALAWTAWTEFLTTISLARLNPMPAGAIMSFAGVSTPVGFIKAQGQLLSRAAYPELFSAISTTYGPGDGSTTFRLPDFRGQFIRGLDDGAGVDPGRALGSSQADENKAHTHGYQDSTGTVFDAAAPASTVDVPKVDGTDVARTTASSGGTESRPKNIAVNILIRY